MHLALVILVVFSVWRYGDWKNWRKYHDTMLYIIMGNLLYYFLYHDHILWHFQPDFLFTSHFLIELLYTFIILPGSALILLTDYPIAIRRQALRIGKFILIFVTMEWIFYINELIHHENGWNMWWSLGWNSMMFPMLVLHHKKPLAAYIISILIFIFMITLFPVPDLF